MSMTVSGVAVRCADDPRLSPPDLLREWLDPTGTTPAATRVRLGDGRRRAHPVLPCLGRAS